MHRQVSEKRTLVLVGGGHSHAIFLRHVAMRRGSAADLAALRGWQIILVSDVIHAPYSGTLPGLMEGVIQFKDAHIDLERLCMASGCMLVQARALYIDTGARRLEVSENRPPLYYDTLSLNVGGTSEPGLLPTGTNAVSVKPIATMLEAWSVLMEECRRAPERPRTLVFVGGGAAGVESALAARERLRKANNGSTRIVLLEAGSDILANQSSQFRRLARAALAAASIEVVCEASVRQAQAGGVVLQRSGAVEFMAADRAFFFTPVVAPSWLRASGLPTDDVGFVVIDETMRVHGHRNIFAAGDVAVNPAARIARAGVFAVRQAKILCQNLLLADDEMALARYKPQRRFLVILGTGGGRAIAGRGAWAAEGRWAWRWKRWIDERFIRSFVEIEPMPGAPAVGADEEFGAAALLRCRGCAAKIGSSTLEDVMARVRDHAGRLKMGAVLDEWQTSADASTLRDWQGSLVQSVDYFPAIVDDPFVFGQIAVHHACSDIYAVGGNPHSVLVLAIVPLAADAVVAATLEQLLAGVVSALHANGAKLIGGHSAEGKELALGLTVNGRPAGERIFSKHGIQQGDKLILTKKLGTGVIFAAHMRGHARGEWIAGATRSMLRSNRMAAASARPWVRCATDVTGFGLIGHLREMLTSRGAADVAVTIDLDSVPFLDGALDLAAAGSESSLYKANVRQAAVVRNWQAHSADARAKVLFDPQTSGGLLFAVPEAEAGACIEALRAAGDDAACVIGSAHAAAASSHRQPIILA